MTRSGIIVLIVGSILGWTVIVWTVAKLLGYNLF